MVAIKYFWDIHLNWTDGQRRKASKLSLVYWSRHLYIWVIIFCVTFYYLYLQDKIKAISPVELQYAGEDQKPFASPRS